MSFIKYIADENHYKEVLSLVGKAKQTVWIGTADIKDLYVDNKPFLALIASLLFKFIIIDSTIAYVGSANLTGAGMGMKSPRKRRSALPLCSAKNFEAGILTDDPEMVEAAIEQFDNVWIGKFFASSSINAARTGGLTQTFPLLTPSPDWRGPQMFRPHKIAPYADNTRFGKNHERQTKVCTRH